MWGETRPLREGAGQAEKKLIFLSIGYSSATGATSCSRSRFRTPRSATLLNARYLPILVDREEMPDVDVTYLAFLQTMNDGKAGWPANSS